MNDNIEYRIDPRPDHAAFAMLWRAAWGHDWNGDLDRILDRSLGHLGAYDSETLIGFVNVAWDGGAHASSSTPACTPATAATGSAQPCSAMR